MNNYFNDWKSLKNEIGIIQIIDGLFASLFYGLFLLLPMVLILMEFIIVFYYLLNLWVVIFMVLVMGLSILQMHWWKKAIDIKYPQLKTNINRLFKSQLLIHQILIVIIGLLFIFIFIPMMQI